MTLRIPINLAAHCLLYVLLCVAAGNDVIDALTDAVVGRGTVFSLAFAVLAAIVGLLFSVGVLYAFLRISGRRRNRIDWYYENIPFGYLIPLPSSLNVRTASLYRTEGADHDNNKSSLSRAGKNSTVLSPKTTRRERIIARAIIILPVAGAALWFNGTAALPILIGLLIFGLARAKFFSEVERHVFPEAQEYYKEQSVQKVIFGVLAAFLLLFAARCLWIATHM